MRTLLALTIFAFAACGGTQPKKESAIVTEGDTAPTCCCKTLPKTAEKETGRELLWHRSGRRVELCICDG